MTLGYHCNPHLSIKALYKWVPWQSGLLQPMGRGVGWEWPPQAGQGFLLGWPPEV